jgi:CrcB protein
VTAVPLWGWALAVAAGGLGALLRTALVRAFARHVFPTGVLVANTLASGVAAAALARRASLDTVWVVVIVGGFCGALSVVSTLVVDTVELWIEGRRRAALRNLLANVASSLGVAWAAYAALS